MLRVSWTIRGRAIVLYEVVHTKTQENHLIWQCFLVNILYVVVFEPSKNKVAVAAANKLSQSNNMLPNMTPGRAALICLIDRYLNGLMDPCVSLLEIHKLVYFMQVIGEPLRLKFKKAFYGPYAENLRHVLQVLEGHWITGYSGEGDKSDQQIELHVGALAAAKTFLENNAQFATIKHLERVSQLVDGFETAFGLELLATVHWVVTHEQADTLDGIIKKVYAWNNRKQQFSARQIGIAYQKLQQRGWIN